LILCSGSGAPCVPDGSAVVASDGTFQYTARNIEPGAHTWQVRPVDPFSAAAGGSSGLVGQWVTFEFTLLGLPAPVVASLELQSDEGPVGEDPLTQIPRSSSSPTLIGAVGGNPSVTGLIVEFDHDGDGVPDGAAAADLLGAFTHTPAALAYGPTTIRARAVGRAGSQILVGHWTDATASLEFFHISLVAPVVSQLEVEDQATGTITGRLTVGGFGRAGTVEVAIGAGMDPARDGYVETDANGFFRYTLRGLSGENPTVQARGIVSDPVNGKPVEGEWEDIDIVGYAPVTPDPPTLQSFELAYDTGDDDQDGLTASPTLRGMVDTTTPQYVVIEFDLGNNGTVDGEVAVRPDGSFEFTPAGLAEDDHSIAARWKYWDPTLTTPAYVTATSWSSPVTFTLDLGENAPASVAELELRQFVTGAGGTPQSADPTFKGTVANDGGHVAGFTVRFDHDGDGAADGWAVTDAAGRFVYRAEDLTPGTDPQTIAAWV
jgi:hypothetical protein